MDLPPSDKIIQPAFFEKYTTLIEAEKKIKKVIEHLIDCFTIRAIRFSGGSMEIVPKGASKWSALEFLLQRDGIAPDEVLAIEDDINDVEMIKNAGFGVAMANAFEKVRSVADYMILDRDDDGAAVLIEQLL